VSARWHITFYFDKFRQLNDRRQVRHLPEQIGKAEYRKISNHGRVMEAQVCVDMGENPHTPRNWGNGEPRDRYSKCYAVMALS